MSSVDGLRPREGAMTGKIRVAEKITIKAQPSLVDPDSCRFQIDRLVHPGGPFFFKDKQASAGSPLIERVFQIEGVASVLVAEDVVAVGKTQSASWSELVNPIGAAIRTQLMSPVPAILGKCVARRNGPRSEAEIREDVQSLLEDEVNPAVERHGGKISLVDVKGAVVYIRMSGGCQGCGAASVTLKQGVEVMIREQIPEVVQIVDATDHAAGEAPFYAPSK